MKKTLYGWVYPCGCIERLDRRRAYGRYVTTPLKCCKKHANTDGVTYSLRSPRDNGAVREKVEIILNQ